MNGKALFAGAAWLSWLTLTAFPADIISTWNGTTGPWSDANRWSSADFPNNGNGGFTYDAIINSGTVTLDLGVVIQALSMTGGTLTGASDLTANELLTFSGGTMGGAGTTVAAGGLALSGSGNKVVDAGRTLLNQANATWTAGTINLNGSAPGVGLLVNASSGVLDNSFNGTVTSSSFIGDPGTNARLDNNGIFRKSGGTGTTTISVRFNNAGTVEVQSGTVSLTTGGTHTGTFDIAGGSTLRFGGGTHAIDGGSTTSTGRMLVAAGSVNVSVPYSIAGLTELTAGTLTFAENSSTGDYLQSAGTLAGAGDLQVQGTSTFTAGTMAGAGDTIATGDLFLNTGANKVLDAGRTLVNHSTATWTGGVINLNGSSPGAGFLRNAAGGVFDNAFDGAITSSAFIGDPGTDARFNNEGTLLKSAGAGVTTIGVPLHNSGTLDVQSGTVSLTAGSTQSGILNVAPGATIHFGGGTHALSGGSTTSPGRILVSTGSVNVNASYKIAGLTELTGGTLNFTANSSAAAYTQSGGTLAGAGNLTVSGLTTFNAGTMLGAGTTFATGGLALETSNNKVIDAGRTLVNQGLASWTAGHINLNGSVPGAGILINEAGGVFDNSFDGTLTSSAFLGDPGTDAYFDNQGIFRKSAGNGTTTIRVQFNNGGIVEVHSGTLELSQGGIHSGVFDIAAVAVLRFDGGIHTISGGSVTSPGRVLVSTGAVNITDAYAIEGLTQLAGGTLTLAANSTTGAFTQSGGALNGVGDLTVAGHTLFVAGTMSGAGTTIAVGGLSLDKADQKHLDAGRTLVNQGAAVWASGHVNLNSNLPGVGKLINASGGVLNNTFDGTLLASDFIGDPGTDARFDNHGTFRKSGGTGTTTIGVQFNNTGAVEVHSGALDLIRPVPQHAGDALVGGTWRSISTAGSAVITLHGSNINRIGEDATVELSGPSPVIQVGTTPLQNTLNRNDGTLRIFNGHDFAPLGATFTNAGTIELGGSGLVGGSFTPATTLNNTGTIRGHGQLNNHVLNSERIEGDFATELVTINGLLGGAGVLKNVEINGIHSPGPNIAAVELEGLFSLTSAASLIIDIGRSAGGIEHDQLNSTGTVNLAGQLDVQVLNLGNGNVVPSAGQQFPIITATGPITGSFANSLITTIASGVEIEWHVVYATNAVMLEAASVIVPLPGDYNGDGAVDAADYIVWRKTLGTNILTADGNADGVIDGHDYSVWRANFGQTGGGAAAVTHSTTNVPEPASTFLFASFAAIAVWRHRCGSHRPLLAATNTQPP
jgi:hypothetical protein